MKVAKVTGNIWATRKEGKLADPKLLLAQPLDMLTGKAERSPIVTADIIGTGVEETVLVIGGSSARSIVGDMSTLVDATMVGTVDDQEIDRSVPS